MQLPNIIYKRPGVHFTPEEFLEKDPAMEAYFNHKYYPSGAVEITGIAPAGSAVPDR